MEESKQEILAPDNVLEILKSKDFPDDKLFQFKGTTQELEAIIRETLLSDPNLQRIAKNNQNELEAWNKEIGEKEDQYRKQQVQLNELVKEKELLTIEYQAKLKKIRGESSKSRTDSSYSQTRNQAASAVDDDIVIIGTKPANTSATKGLKVGQELYVSKGHDVWKKGVLLELVSMDNESYMYKVRVEKKIMTLSKSKIAFPTPPQRNVRLGTRVIAAYTEVNGIMDFYSGIVAEPPYEGNKFRYLIFFDDGCAQYSKTGDIRVVVEQLEKQWEATHADLQDFIKRYIETYGKRRILRLSVGQRVRVERDGEWHMAHCVKVDCSLVKMMFNLKNQFNTEWIYRGSTRFLPLYKDSLLNNDKKMRSQAVQGYRSRGRGGNSANNSGKVLKYNPPSTQNQPLRSMQPIVKAIFSAPKRDEHAGVRKPVPYPKYANRRFFAPHPKCTERCIGVNDLSIYKSTYLLSIPIHFGFERHLIRAKRSKNSYQTSKKLVSYRTPCGRTLRNIQEVGIYLDTTKCKLSIDMFSFEQALHLFEPFKPTGVQMEIRDISQNRENVALSCVNALSSIQPDKLIYSGVRMPQKDVKLTTDPNFMICCNCTDNCQDKSKCACQQLTYEGQQIIHPDTPLEKSGYQYRRLILDNENYSNITTGIYECNSQCKCKKTCFNRVVQNPLSSRLQIFKTELRGWGIRCLDDLPEGSFICIYAGQLHSDECADEDGREYGDEYFAELDFIEVAESLKEACYEEVAKAPGSSDEEKRSDSEWEGSDSESGDSDFNTPSGFQISSAGIASTKQLREKKSVVKPPTDRELTDKDDETDSKSAKGADESGELPEGYKSLRTYFGETNPYVMDAKTSGNLGRYLNHSCEPNVFVQTVFVDTHDPRFPWIAFFANSFIRAGTELTWDYGYRPGLVEGKVMYCHCKSKNCRGRLL